MSSTPPAPEVVRALVRAVIEHAPVEAQPRLFEQAECVEYVDGPVTMMNLRVRGDVLPARGVASPVSGGPSVVDADGDDVGLLLLWLDDAGFINCLEYGWVTDEMPTELPQPS